METMPGRAAECERVFLDGLAAGLPGGGFFAAPFVVAVSGGGDSVALLLGLHALARAADAPDRLVVAHGLHDLRDEAAADAEFVRRLAADLCVRCVVAPLSVRHGGGGEGVEARARRLRYAFLAGAAHDHGARHVAVAHTADDQAETILHRALRGTGVAGLAGMRRSRELAAGVALVRPLLDVSRAAARDYLRSVSQAWCEDATNADTRRARGFLRHELLPRCEEGPYPAATAALTRLGRQAAEVAATLAAAADVVLEAHAAVGPDGGFVIAAPRLARLDPPVVTAVFAAVWRRAGWPLRDMTAAHYGRLAALVAAAAAAPAAAPTPGCDFPGGVRVELARDGRLTLARRG
jgi:tRNA(Ile)-lysidine synthase